MSGQPAPLSVMDRHPEVLSISTARTRTILLAEDDDAVRGFVRTVLEQAGFAVVTASDGRAAGDLFAAAPDRFAMVLTDVVMPYAIGPELAARARALRPNVPVLFMSAFPGGPGLPRNALPAHEPLLEKPFSVSALLAAVAGALSLANAECPTGPVGNAECPTNALQ
jgi:two-component system, cell cycle response regulator CpdR